MSWKISSLEKLSEETLIKGKGVIKLFSEAFGQVYVFVYMRELGRCSLYNNRRQLALRGFWVEELSRIEKITDNQKTGLCGVFDVRSFFTLFSPFFPYSPTIYFIFLISHKLIFPGIG